MALNTVNFITAYSAPTGTIEFNFTAPDLPTFGLSVEVDSVQNAVSSKSASFGIAAESNTSPLFVANKKTAINVAVEIDIALDFSDGKTYYITPIEIDSAPLFSAKKLALVSISTEANTSSDFIANHSASLDVASELDSAFNYSSSKVAAIGLSAEIDTVNDFTTTIPFFEKGIEADSAFNYSSSKVAVFGLAVETDSSNQAYIVDAVDIHFEVNSIATDTPVDIHFEVNSIASDDVNIHFEVNSIVLTAVDIHFEVNSIVSQDVDIHFEVNSRANEAVYSGGAVSNELRWTVSVILGGVDVSALLTGKIVIEREEGASTLADFEMLPFAGVVDIYDWVGKTVTIDMIELDADGIEKGAYRRFTGEVNKPIFNPNNSYTQFSCTDNLQRSVENSSREIIDSRLVGSKWAKEVFNEPRDNWSYHLQRMTTIEKSYELDRFGVQRLTDWQAKAVADYTFTNDDVYFNSLSIPLQVQRNLTNNVKIEFSHRYNRRWQRSVKGLWVYPNSLTFQWFKEWLDDPFSLPEKDMIYDALDAQGWVLDNINFTGLPETGIYGSYATSGQTVWTLTDFAKTLVVNFDFSAHSKWLQTITDKYVVNIASQASIDKFGEFNSESSYTMATSSEDAWEDDDALNITSPTIINATDKMEKSFVVNEDKAALDNAIETAILIAKNEIRSSHRESNVEFKVMYEPLIDIVHTVEISTTNVNTKGKIKRLVETLDIETGDALSHITLAVSQPNIGGQTDDSLSAPDSPHVLPVNEASDIKQLDSHYGNLLSSPPDDETWRGYIGNDQLSLLQGAEAINKGINFYDERMVIEFPEVSTLERDAQEYENETTINISIPQDNLIVTS